MTTPTTPVLHEQRRQRAHDAGGRQGEQPADGDPAGLPQRTVVPRRPMPEPMTEPEATCVVDRAKPRCEEARMAEAVLVSAAKPWAGFTSVRPEPMVRMIRQPPAYVPMRDGQGAGGDDPQLRAGAGRLRAGGDQDQGDDAHGLLGVVGAVGQRHEAGREDLAGPEAAALLRELVSGFGVMPGGQGVRQPGAQVGHAAGDDRGERPRENDLLERRTRS